MTTARRSAAYVLSATVLFFVFSPAVVAQQSGVAALSEWYGQSSQRTRYRSVEPELVQIFRTSDSLSLPPSLLLNRLNFAAARRLSPEVLLRGMHEELVRLKTAAGILAELGTTKEGRKLVASSTNKELLNAVSIYLSGGLSPRLLSELMTAGAKRGRTADETFQACAVLLAVDRVGPFPDGELLALGSSLIASSVAAAGYAAVGSFIVRAIATGRGGGSILVKVEQILHQGGGLPQMELELGRRR